MSSAASDVVIGSHLTPTSVATAGAVGSFVLPHEIRKECPERAKALGPGVSALLTQRKMFFLMVDE